MSQVIKIHERGRTEEVIYGEWVTLKGQVVQVKIDYSFVHTLEMLFS